MLGFYALPMMTLLASLATLPVIARHVDARTWVAVAVGQSIGSVAAFASYVGWTFNGPIQLPGRERSTKAEIFGESLSSRVSILAVIAPIAAVAAMGASRPGTGEVAAWFAVSTCLIGLSPVWFCVGEGRAKWAAWYDAFPRLTASLAGAALIISGASILVLPILLGLTSLVCSALFAYMVHTRYGSIRPRRSLRDVVARQLPAMLTNVVAGAYSTAAVTLVSLSTSTYESARFASGARLYALVLFGITVATQAVLVDTRRGRQTRRHLKVTLGIYAGTAALGFIGVGVLAGWISRILLTKSFEVKQPDALLFGLSYVCVALGTWVCQTILLPLGDRAWNLASVCVGAVVGVPAIVWLGHRSGSAGGASGLAVSELVVLCVLAIGGRLTWRGRDVSDIPVDSPAARPDGPEGGSPQLS
jgi:PST family polysaccharide transporter